MLAEISAGLGSLKAALDITKGLNAANTQTSVNDVKIPLQQHIIEAQMALSAANDAQSAATHRIGELEQEIVSLKDWSAEKQRYQLKALDSGAFAYSLKEGMEAGEPAHLLCANCFNQGHKALLQTETRMPMRTEYAVCNRCNAEIIICGSRHPDHGRRR